ncbi:hypothetical protein [Allosphingosinicella flava]|nr:hypothetical protein [Sphingosinicella flava]
MVATVAQAQQATYWMTAETGSGMNLQPGLAGLGKKQQDYTRNLRLHLGSSRSAAADAKAEHIPPADLGAGPALPLKLVKDDGGREKGIVSWEDLDIKGRMLIYWGCGNNVRANQPAIIDFSKAKQAGAKIIPASILQFSQPPLPSAKKNASYSNWPNEKSSKPIPAQGSLAGDHVVRGAYTPDISFSLSQNQDFLAPVVLTSSTSPAADGTIQLAWNPVVNAKGYFAMAQSSAANGDMVYWSSSEVPTMGAPDFMQASEINRLLQKKALLGQTQTQCTIPAEVAKHLSGAMLNISAFGPEASFSHPPKPANAKADWRPEWTAHLLTKASYFSAMGMEAKLAGRGRDDDAGAEGDEEETETPEQAKKSLLKKGVGGLLKKVF